MFDNIFPIGYVSFSKIHYLFISFFTLTNVLLLTIINIKFKLDLKKNKIIYYMVYECKCILFHASSVIKVAVRKNSMLLIIYTIIRAYVLL